MHLIATLAAGIATAAAGTAVLKKRGTSANATYYKSFEAAQAYSASPIALDSSGAAELYVNELVDVLVYDINGVLQLAFTAGAAAPAIEVISQSFTGTSYTDGSSGTNKPTTLQKVLDAWLTSAGSADFNVLVGPTPTTIQLAVAGLSGLFFNVKTYGAIGNGAANDTAAIQAAYTAAAATATAAGTVFFPPGIYRYASTITVPTGVKTLGSGGRASKLVIDGAVTPAMQFTGGVGLTVVDGIWFDSVNTNFNGDLVSIPGGATGAVQFSDCTFGGGSVTTRGRLLRSDATAATASLRANGCYFGPVAGAIVNAVSAAGLVEYNDCDFVNSQGIGISLLGVVDGAVVIGCRFSAASVAAVYFGYITGTFTSFGATVAGCYFGPSGIVCAALFTNGATPTADFYDAGNLFIGPNVIPYDYTTAGWTGGSNQVTRGNHGSRSNETAIVTSNAANVTLEAQLRAFCGLNRTGAGAQAITATPGRQGELLTVTIYNNSGGALTPTFGGTMITRAGYVTNINNLGTRIVQFVWQPTLVFGGTGAWMQSAPETTF